MVAAIAVACTLVVFNFEGSAPRVAAFTSMLVLWVVAAALALHVDARLCPGGGAGGDDGRILPVFGTGGDGDEAARATEEDLDDDGKEETLIDRINSRFETAKEVFDEYSGEFIGNGDIAEWGAKGLKMATKMT